MCYDIFEMISLLQFNIFLGASITIYIIFGIVVVILAFCERLFQAKLAQPYAVVSVCAIWTAIVFFVFQGLMSACLMKRLASANGKVIFLDALFNVLCIFGLFQMRRWAVIGLLTTILLFQLHLLIVGSWSPLALLPFMITLPCFPYYRRMH